MLRRTLCFLATGLVCLFFWLPHGHAGQAAVLPDGEMVCSGQIYAPRGGMRVRQGAVRCDELVSPKSANFSPDGTRLYLNALESSFTLVYSFPELRQVAAIRHAFGPADGHLFQGENTVFSYQYHSRPSGGNPNIFWGKPVEAAFSHGGKYLWIPYYRRSFDANASSPSAAAIIETASNRIVRVMPTGPLPKVVAISPDNTLAAITHWGDNTVGIIDISSDTPQEFRYVRQLVVGHKLSTAGIRGDRDRNCGFCLRGTVFTPDSKHLLVGRMGGGGISCFAMPEGKLLGSLTAFCNTPRHLTLDPEGKYLYASNHKEGTVGRVLLADFLKSAANADGKSMAGPAGEKIHVGRGVRTIAVSPDGKKLYAAVNMASLLLEIDIPSWRIARKTRVSPFAVGLGVHPDGSHVAVTSQGREGSGGNSVEIFQTSLP